jgi:hypothetical protein
MGDWAGQGTPDYGSRLVSQEQTLPMIRLLIHRGDVRPAAKSKQDERFAAQPRSIGSDSSRAHSAIEAS